MKKYCKGNLVVFWYPEKCTHAGVCFRNLPQVFKPAARPWVNLDNAQAEEIILTVEKCPSKALVYELLPEKVKEG